MNKRFLLLLLFILFFQIHLTAQISGTIKDTKGNPLPFAAVFIKGTTTGTFSNDEGEYLLKLKRGNNTVVFKYVGFETQELEVENKGEKIHKDIILKTDDIILKAITITANAEDPAYAIIRKAVKARKNFRKKPNNYKANIYQKLKLELLDAPKKIMGMEVAKTEEDKKEMEELLDTNSNVILVTETVSEFFKGQGNQWKEKIISSRISGNKKGYSNMSSLFTNLDFYEDYIPIGRKLISPISSNAMMFYKYKLLGTFYENNGNLINKIQIIPKRKYDPVFSGTIFITDSIWNINSINVTISSKNTNIRLLDTISIKQIFQLLPGEKDEWGLLSQYSVFTLKFLAFKAQGYHTRNFINYQLHQKFEKGFFDKIKIKIDEKSNKRDSIYWKKIRPVPLSIKESKSYFRMDSIEKMQSSKEYLDSTDRISNKPSWKNILTGYTYSNSYKKSFWRLISPLMLLNFNPVQGIYADTKIIHTKYKENKNYYKIVGSFQYGFADKRVLPMLKFYQMLNNKYKFAYSIEAGNRYFQPDRALVNPFYNSITALDEGKNYIKLYEKKYINFAVMRNFISGIKAGFFIEYNERNSLVNHSNFMFFNKGIYPPNIYEEQDHIKYNKKLNFKIKISYKPGMKYVEMPYEYIPVYSKYPLFEVEYEKALPIDRSFVSYDRIKGKIIGYLQTGILGYLNYKFEGGLYPGKNKTDIIDDNYFDGSQMYFMSYKDFTYSFHLLPYYFKSDFKPWITINLQQKLKGLIIGKIPLLKRLKTEEVISANILKLQGKAPYYELGFGLDKIMGYFSFRYSVSFRGKEYEDQGVRLSLSLPFKFSME